MASREELWQLLRAGKKMDKDIAYKIYADSITQPEFEEKALSLMEWLYERYADPEDRNPRELYKQIITEYQLQHDNEIRTAMQELRRQREKSERRKEEGDEKRKDQEMELLNQKKMLLMQKLQRLTSN